MAIIENVRIYTESQWKRNNGKDWQKLEKCHKNTDIKNEDVTKCDNYKGI